MRQERAGIGRPADKRDKPSRFPALTGHSRGLVMADENDFTDHLHVVRPSRVEMTLPAMAERTPKEEEHAELDKLEEELTKRRLEEIGRNSDLLFKDPVWITPHALNLIAFRDKKRIADNSWYGHVLYFDSKDGDELTTLRKSASPPADSRRASKGLVAMADRREDSSQSRWREKNSRVLVFRELL